MIAAAKVIPNDEVPVASVYKVNTCACSEVSQMMQKTTKTKGIYTMNKIIRIILNEQYRAKKNSPKIRYKKGALI